MSEEFILHEEYKRVAPKNEAVEQTEVIKNAENEWWRNYFSPSSPMTPCRHSDGYGKIF